MVERYKARFALDSRIRAMIIREAQKNLWRVRPLYELDDLIQEGFLCYVIARAKYGHAENYGHFMRLVRTIFMNQINDLATARTRDRETVYESREPTVTHNGTLVSQAYDLGGMTLVAMPAELMRFVEAMLTGAEQISVPLRDGVKRETNNERHCRLIGADPKQINLEDELYRHLTA